MSKKAKRTQYVSNTLPDYLLKLAKKSDFCMWQHEKHKPEGATIDWSCQYDKEMKLYSEMLIKRVCKEIRDEIEMWASDKQTALDCVDDVKSNLLAGFDKLDPEEFKHFTEEILK